MSGPGRHFLVRADEIHMGNMSELAPIKLINLGYYECVAESAAPVRRTIARRTTANLNNFGHQRRAWTTLSLCVPIKSLGGRLSPTSYRE